uniref:Uncharacterized protein n=1 Tax=Mus musculus TaxID=10090 RepID=Q3U0D5_MOUSE|nr:unnamed protein product [Mus musculus]
MSERSGIQWASGKEEKKGRPREKGLRQGRTAVTKETEKSRHQKHLQVGTVDHGGRSSGIKMMWCLPPASLSHITGAFILHSFYSSYLRLYVYTVQMRASMRVEARGWHQVSSLVIILHLIF